MAGPNPYFQYKISNQAIRNKSKKMSYYNQILDDMEEAIERWKDDNTTYYSKTAYVDGYFEVLNNVELIVDNKKHPEYNKIYKNMFCVRYYHPIITDNRMYIKYYDNKNIRRVCRNLMTRVNSFVI
jgi:hypothetical protein